MPTSSIPKHRLIQLIITGLNASAEAAAYFHISTAASLEERLMSFSKPDLVAFVASLGPNAEVALRNLETAFPLRRPPTLYLAFLESVPPSGDLIDATREFALHPRKNALITSPEGPIPLIFIDETARVLDLGDRSALQLVLRYERRIEFIVANAKSDEYGMPSSLNSLETGFVWIPLTKASKHAVIASCDYPAVHHIITYLHSSLTLRLYLTNLDVDTLRVLVANALPRSATFTTTFDDPDEVKTLTISDPILSSKTVFASAAQSSKREQTSGFYVNHPGLPSGGMGVSRRDGRVWIPSRLDYAQLARLALQLIEQTETKLRGASDPGILVTHYYGSRARIGDREIFGPPHLAWKDLLRSLLIAAKSPDRQAELSLSLLERLVRYQARLSFATGLQTLCPSCGYASLASCPTCRTLLSLRLAPTIRPACRSSQHGLEPIACDCGTEFEPSPVADAYLVPEPPLLESLCRAAANIAGEPFDVFFVIVGTSLKLAPAVSPTLPPELTLLDLALWHSRAHFATVKGPSAKNRHAILSILNRTKEKCRRDGIRPSNDRCSECKTSAPHPDWLPAGDLCLPRVLGIAIDEPFDGVHHGLELADVKYADSLLPQGPGLRLGIHVKSRLSKAPPEGVGRSKAPIKGLYAQLAYSAYTARSGAPRLDVIGVAIPNTIHPEVTQSMRFAANKMGYSFLAVAEDEWLKIVRIAIEKIEVGA